MASVQDLVSTVIVEALLVLFFTCNMFIVNRNDTLAFHSLIVGVCVLTSEFSVFSVVAELILEMLFVQFSVCKAV